MKLRAEIGHGLAGDAESLVRVVKDRSNGHRRHPVWSRRPPGATASVPGVGPLASRARPERVGIEGPEPRVAKHVASLVEHRQRLLALPLTMPEPERLER